jgi:hypothetical protein
VGTITVYYWRKRSQEVDFVIKSRNRLAALEVKSLALGKPHSGLNKFQNHWPEAKAWERRRKLAFPGAQ